MSGRVNDDSWKPAMLAALARTGSVVEAIAEARISHYRYYRELQADPEFLRAAGEVRAAGSPDMRSSRITLGWQSSRRPSPAQVAEVEARKAEVRAEGLAATRDVARVQGTWGPKRVSSRDDFGRSAQAVKVQGSPRLADDRERLGTMSSDAFWLDGPHRSGGEGKPFG